MPSPTGTTSILAVVLAAGEGRRLGRGPKAHVVLAGETFLERVVRCCRDAGLGEIWVVGRPNDAALAPACAALRVSRVLNPHPELGMFSSVRAAIAATQPAASAGLLLFPVDHPHVLPDTLRRLAQELVSREPLAWVRPVHEGRRGHPIAIGAGLLPRLLAEQDTVPLNDALHRAGGMAFDVACEDPGVLSNVNRPADLTSP